MRTNNAPGTDVFVQVVLVERGPRREKESLDGALRVVFIGEIMGWGQGNKYSEGLVKKYLNVC